MFDLKKFRESVNLRQTDIASMFGCAQPRIAYMEKRYSDLTYEQRKILSDKFGENTLLKFTISDDALPTEAKEQKFKDNYIDESDWSKLIFEQQQSIKELISMVKKLQEENMKLTDALLKTKIV